MSVHVLEQINLRHKKLQSKEKKIVRDEKKNSKNSFSSARFRISKGKESQIMLNIKISNGMNSCLRVNEGGKRNYELIKLIPHRKKCYQRKSVGFGRVKLAFQLTLTCGLTR